MAHTHPQSTVAIAGYPFYSLFVQFPVVCFTLALFADIAYWGTAHLMWHNFAAWLLFAGMVFGVLAAIVGTIEYFVRSGAHPYRPGWPYVIGTLVVLALAFVNNLVHAGDGWTAIVPWGLILSAATVVAMIVAGWLGRAFMTHHNAGSA